VPTAGTAKIAGHDMRTDRQDGAAKLGYLPENGPLYPDMTPRGLLEFFAAARGLSTTNARATFLFVTHDQVEAMSMGDRIGVLVRGRLAQSGTPAEIYANPKNTFVARSVGSPPMNLIDGAVSGGAAVTEAGFSLPVSALAGHEGRQVTFGVRPEDIRLDPEASAKARVHDVENHGVEKIVTIAAGDELLHLTAPASHRFQIDDTIAFSWNPGKILIFDRESGRNITGAA
jgi:multiple sugar transport system ATP-binding protein